MRLRYQARHAAGRLRRKFVALPALGALAMTPILIHPGDTMGGIAASHGVSLGAVEAANPQIANPNLIYAGQTLNLPGDGSSSAPPASSSFSQRSQQPSPSASSSSDLADVPGVPYAYAKCVAFRESTNNPSAVNSIPGYIGNGGGAYGFLTATWQGLGYSGQPFNASVAEQKQAFSRLYAQLGRSPWVSDGC